MTARQRHEILKEARKQNAAACLLKCERLIDSDQCEAIRTAITRKTRPKGA